jgi:hypothetical protein
LIHHIVVVITLNSWLGISKHVFCLHLSIIKEFASHKVNHESWSMQMTISMNQVVNVIVVMSLCSYCALMSDSWKWYCALKSDIRRWNWTSVNLSNCSMNRFTRTDNGITGHGDIGIHLKPQAQHTYTNTHIQCIYYIY